MIRSLNVSVATAVILFEAVRQRTLAGYYDGSKLPDEELARLLKEWEMKE
jgi:tRNA (guanosine-2'-O-)-methyltransferase